MKKIINYISLALILLTALPNSANAQEKTGIRFEEKSFTDILKKSAQSNKLIFVDAYTSWCIPCKWMDKNVFVNDTISTFYNANFVNFKQDMEKGEGPDLKKKYNVAVYPTYLFLSSDGTVLHRSTSKMEVQEFLKLGEAVLNPTKTLSVLNAKYELGNRSTEFLWDFMITLKQSRDPRVSKIKEELLTSLTDDQLVSELGWRIIQQFPLNETDRLGKLLMANQLKFETIGGKTNVQKVIDQMATSSLYSLSRQDPDKFMAKLNALKKTSSDQRSLVLTELSHYMDHKKSNELLVLMKAARNNYFRDNAMDLSFIIRKIAQDNFPDEKVRQEAYEIGKMTIAMMPDEYSIQGTFADVCYIMHKKEEGVQAASKALALAKLMDSSKIEKLAKERLTKLESLK
jgi:thiol-disulfide isomerase/thioredoxin